MKLSKFNTTDACNIPQKLSLRDPFSGEVLKDEDGRTVDIYVYGFQSDVSRNALRERDRKYGKTKEMDDEVATQAGAEYLAAITHGWSETVENDDGPLPFNRKNAIELYKEQDWLARQVNLFSMDLRNYDPKRLSESDSGPDDSVGSTRARQTPSKRGGSKAQV